MSYFKKRRSPWVHTVFLASSLNINSQAAWSCSFRALTLLPCLAQPSHWSPFSVPKGEAKSHRFVLGVLLSVGRAGATPTPGYMPAHLKTGLLPSVPLRATPSLGRALTVLLALTRDGLTPMSMGTEAQKTLDQPND